MYIRVVFSLPKMTTTLPAMMKDMRKVAIALATTTLPSRAHLGAAVSAFCVNFSFPLKKKSVFDILNQNARIILFL